MAEQVASLYASLELRDSMTPGLKKAEGEVNAASGTMQKSAGSLDISWTKVGATMVGIGGAALKMAMDFDAAATNVQAVTNMTDAQIAGLKDQLFDLHTTFSDTQEMNALYDIVGAGITDQADAMATLTASIHAAQAGQSELGGATNALIAIMNSYSLKANDATHATDVLSGTVAAGKGTYDEFAGAFALTAGTAAQVGVSLEELGFALSSITQKGFSAAQSATQVNAIITAMLKPNKDMKAAFEEAGIASGSLALQQFGLAGALNLVYDALDNNNDAFARALGSDEALRGGLALTAADVADKFDAFSSSLDGATAKAEAIQLDSASAQFALLKQNVNSAATELANFALPTVNEGFAAGVQVTALVDWLIGGEDLQTAAQDAVDSAPPVFASIPVTSTYEIQSGDTPETIAEKTGSTVDDVWNAAYAQGLVKSVPLTMKVSTLAGVWGVPESRVVEIMNLMGDNIPTQVDHDYVANFAAAHPEFQDLDVTSLTALAQQEFNASIGAQGVNVTLTPTMVLDLAEAGAITYAQAQAWIDSYTESRQWSAKFPTTGTIELKNAPQASEQMAGLSEEFVRISQTSHDADQNLNFLGRGFKLAAVAGDEFFKSVMHIDLGVTTKMISDLATQVSFLTSNLDKVPGAVANVIGLDLSSNYTPMATPMDTALNWNRTFDTQGYEQYFSMYSGMSPSDYVGGGGGGMNLAPSEESKEEMDSFWGQFGELYDKYNTEGINVHLADPKVASNLGRDLTNATHPYPVDVPLHIFLAGKETYEGYAAGQVREGFVPPAGSGVAPTPYAEGGWSGGGGLATLHPNEWVVPPGGSDVRVVPTPNGLVMQGGGGGGEINFYGDNYFYGVTDMPALVDKVDEIRKQRG